MKTRALLLALALSAAPLLAGEAPDTSRILSVVGRFTVAHACPVAPDVVLSNAHVFDLRPFDPQIPPFPYRFEGGGVTGWLHPNKVFSDIDLGTAVPTVPVQYYPIATQPPTPGEQMWWVAYDWRKKHAFEQKVLTGKVVRVIAGAIVLDQDTPQGSSGSCILNAKGEVVGLIAWSFAMDDQQGDLAVGVGIWGYIPPTPEEAPPQTPPAPQPPDAAAPPVSPSLPR